MQLRMAGIRLADACEPPGPVWVHSWSPCATAMEITSVLVSKASRFIQAYFLCQNRLWRTLHLRKQLLF